jgi:hypothetical protein
MRILSFGPLFRALHPLRASVSPRTGDGPRIAATQPFATGHVSDIDRHGDRNNTLASAPKSLPVAKPRIGPAIAVSILLSMLVAGTNVATVLNNAYYFGSTLYDSAIFQTIIWRSGWSLLPAPAVDDMSFLNVHLSPINYGAVLLSYLMPVDRMTYYGLVYGALYGALVFTAFHALRRAFGLSVLTACLASIAFYLSGPVLSGQWEPHQEIASALFTAIFFVAWADRRRGVAILALCLNAAVREDCGLLLALPLLLLGILECQAKRPISLALSRNATLRYAAASAALTGISFAVKLLWFNRHDSFSSFYYGTDPFSHLSGALLEQRLGQILCHGQYLWLPGVILISAAAWRRDSRLTVGWLAFLPYSLFNFFSKLDLSAELGSYKAFPFIIAVLWPAILALRTSPPERRALGWTQAALLAASILSFENGELRVMSYDPPEVVADR